MFKKSAICIAIGLLSFGGNYDSRVDTGAKYDLKFLLGFSWVTTANASPPCRTEDDRPCPNYPVYPDCEDEWGGRCNKYDPDFDPWPPGFYQPEPPICDYDCGGHGGGNGGAIPGASDIMATGELGSFKAVTAELSSTLAALAASLGLDSESKQRLLKDAGKLNSLISYLDSAETISEAVLYNKLDALGPELLAILFNTSSATIISLGLSAIIGSPGTLAVATIISVTVASVLIANNKDAAWSYLNEIYRGTLQKLPPLPPPPPIHPKPHCNFYMAPDCFTVEP